MKEQKKPKERYLKMPYSILNIGGLGLKEKVLLAYIYGFGEKGCWQSNDTIAKVFFTHPSSIKRWLRRIHKYIYIKCPHGYYRNIWAKSHPDVRAGVKKWVEKERERKAHSRLEVSTVVGQKRPTNQVKTDPLSSSKVVLEPAQKRSTINNHIKKEITEETTPPSPSPAEGAGSAVLADRKTQDAESVKGFTETFGGRKKRTHLSEQQFAERRTTQLRALELSRQK